MPNHPPSTLDAALLRLRLTHTVAHISDFIAHATLRRLGSQEILLEMCHIEMEYQNHQRTNRRLKEAKIDRFKPLTGFDWTWPRQVGRDAIHR